MLRIAVIALAAASAVQAQEPVGRTKVPPSQEVAAAVAADWPQHDRSGKGHLDQGEFVGWLSALRAEGSPRAEDPLRVKSWAVESFRQADSDNDQKVTPEEFAKFLDEKRRK